MKKATVEIIKKYNAVNEIPSGKFQTNQIETLKFTMFHHACNSIANQSWELEKKLARWKKAYSEDIEALKTGNTTRDIDDIRDSIARAEATIAKLTKECDSLKRSIACGKDALYNCVSDALHAEYKKYCVGADNEYVLAFANTLEMMGIPARKKGVDFLIRKIGVAMTSDREIMKSNGNLTKAMTFKSYKELVCRVVVEFVESKCDITCDKKVFEAYNAIKELEKKQAENKKANK